MSAKLQAPRGTFDVLPADWIARSALIDTTAGELFRRAAYGRIETPTFEDTTLFARGVGESTDVVSKEMYSFTDQGDRSLTLRPEGTAPICRSYIEHGMHKLPQPVKLWYSGPFFRQEAPQAARFRQFFQIGCEALGSDDPAVDAESITLLRDLIEAAGVSDYRLRLSSLGSRAERATYGDELKAFLRAHASDLAPDVAARIDQNPLRAFDAKHEATQAVMAQAPLLLDHINQADRDHLDEVKAMLDAVGVTYQIDPTLVRGLDYYTRTVFEFTSDLLGAQSGLGGGGRYDGLVEMLGGQPTPAVGWAAGIERILTAAQAGSAESNGHPAPDADVYIALEDGARKTTAFALTQALRNSGLRVELELAGRSMKGQLKAAARVNANHVVITGGERGTYDVALKHMARGQQHVMTASNIEQLATQLCKQIQADQELPTNSTPQGDTQ